MLHSLQEWVLEHGSAAGFHELDKDNSGHIDQQELVSDWVDKRINRSLDKSLGASHFRTMDIDLDRKVKHCCTSEEYCGSNERQHNERECS